VRDRGKARRSGLARTIMLVGISEIVGQMD
jgi:hypothetical protein